MNYDDIVKTIRKELIVHASKKITVDTLLEKDLGMDSLDLVVLTMALEEEYKVEISDEDAYKMKTVGDVIKYLKEPK